MNPDIKIVSSRKKVKNLYTTTGVSGFLDNCSRIAKKDKWRSLIVLAVDDSGDLVAGFKIRKSKIASQDIVFKGMLSDAQVWYENGEA